MIPAKGSVGASGDPLRWRICRCCCWEGQARWQGEWLPAKRGAERPISANHPWRQKEGWRCLTARRPPRPLRCAVCLKLKDLFASAVVCGALTTEAVLGSRVVRLTRVFMTYVAARAN